MFNKKNYRKYVIKNWFTNKYTNPGKPRIFRWFPSENPEKLGVINACIVCSGFLCTEYFTVIQSARSYYRAAEAFQVNDVPKWCAVVFITTQQLRNDFYVLLVFQMVIPDDFVVGAFNGCYKLSQASFFLLVYCPYIFLLTILNSLTGYYYRSTTSILRHHPQSVD